MGKMICDCVGLTEEKVKEMKAAGKTKDEIIAETAAGTICGVCVADGRIDSIDSIE